MSKRPKKEYLDLPLHPDRQVEGQEYLRAVIRLVIEVEVKPVIGDDRNADRETA